MGSPRQVDHAGLGCTHADGVKVARRCLHAPSGSHGRREGVAVLLTRVSVRRAPLIARFGGVTMTNWG